MNENQHVRIEYLQDTMKTGVNRLVKNTSSNFLSSIEGGIEALRFKLAAAAGINFKQKGRR